MTRPRLVVIALVLAALAIAMSLAVSSTLRGAVAEWETENVTSIVAGELEDVDVATLLAQPGGDGWQAVLGGVAARVPGVVRCKVWSADRIALWADDPSLTGRPHGADDADLRAALAGRAVFRLVDPGPHDTDQAWQSQMLSRIYVPLRAVPDGPVVGAIELRKTPTRLSAHLTKALAIVWGIALAGALALWLVVRRSARRQTRTGTRGSAEIVAEIRERFGFVPPFFEPAVDSPAVLDNLWQQTLSAYVENPLPALFKETLFAYLSRECSVPYCIVCHSCALRPLGMTPGDVLALLESPPPTEPEITTALTVLAGTPGPLAEWPAPGTLLSDALFACAIFMFSEPARAARTQTEMRRLLGHRYARLTEFLAYVKTCHAWVEAHPALAYEADDRARAHLGPLLDQEPRLVEFFRDYRVRVMRERQSAEARRLEELRAEIERARGG